MDSQPTLAEVWNLLQEQRTLVDSQHSMIEEQQSRIALLEEKAARNASRERRVNAQPTDARSRPDPPGERAPLGLDRLSRASVLKAAAGVAGAGALLAASGLTSAPNSLASTGDNLVIGDYNDTGDPTTLLLGGWRSEEAGFCGFTVADDQGPMIRFQIAEHPSATILGYTSGSANNRFSTGILGYCVEGGIGVAGRSDLIGVRGQSTGSGSQNNIGVYGFDSSGYGWGVVGRSLNGTDPTSLGAGLGVMGESGATGTGVLGNGSSGGTGVSGNSDTGTGVSGASSTGTGIVATSGNSIASISESGFPNGASSYAYNTANGWGVIGRSYTDSTQSILGTGIGVEGNSGTGIGVKGTAGGHTGVLGVGTTVRGRFGPRHGSGVEGESDAGFGVMGTTGGGRNAGVYGAAINPEGHGYGVIGRSLNDKNFYGSGFGVLGESGNGAGVQGSATGGTGVIGTSTKGRGIVASGGAAQLRLKPSKSGTHPATGEQGDVFVDSAGRLWYCSKGKPSVSWVQLA